MSHANITRRSLNDMVFALFADAWQLRLVPDEDHAEEPVMSPLYTRGQLIGACGFLRHKNVNGYHIFGRPQAARHVLVDDLCVDALDTLDTDGLTPAVVVRTSKGNYQAWVTVSKDEVTRDVASAIAKLLASRYGGDPGAANWCQVGRLPGFTNRKSIYCGNGLYPWTQMARLARPRVPPGVIMLLSEARKIAERVPTYSSSTLGARDPLAPSEHASPMTPDEAKAIYDQTCVELAERFNWPMPIQDRSRADFAVTRNLAMLGFERADVISVLLHGSAKSGAMKPDRARSYSANTVDRAFNFAAAT